MDPLQTSYFFEVGVDDDVMGMCIEGVATGHDEDGMNEGRRRRVQEDQKEDCSEQKPRPWRQLHDVARQCLTSTSC